MFYVKFFTFCFLVFFSQLQANNPPTKNISLPKVIHSFKLSPLKNTTQTDLLPLHKKSNIAVLVAQQVEKSRSLELKTKSKTKIFDINSIQSHIVYVIHTFKELCIKLMTSACEKDDDIWVQLEDVYFNGRYYRYHVLSQAGRIGTEWDSCSLSPYDDSVHFLYFTDRAGFEAALRGGASVAQIYKMAGLSSDGSPYSGEIVMSNSQGGGSSSGGSSTSSQDLTPSKGTSTGGTASGNQNGSSTASQGGGASSNGVSSGNSGGSPTGTSGIYDVDPSKQQPVQQAPQQSLSSSTGLQTVDAQDAVTKNSIQQQDQQTRKKFEAYLDQKYPGLANLILKDREYLRIANDDLKKMYKNENSKKGKKLPKNDSYSSLVVEQANKVIESEQYSPGSQNKKALAQAHKIAQADATVKAAALKIEQERIAAEKKAADEKKVADYNKKIAEEKAAADEKRAADEKAAAEKKAFDDQQLANTFVDTRQDEIKIFREEKIIQQVDQNKKFSTNQGSMGLLNQQSIYSRDQKIERASGSKTNDSLPNLFKKGEGGGHNFDRHERDCKNQGSMQKISGLFNQQSGYSRDQKTERTSGPNFMKKREGDAHKFDRHERYSKNQAIQEIKSAPPSKTKSSKIRDTKSGEIQQQAQSSENNDNKPGKNKDTKSGGTQDNKSDKNEKDQNNSQEGKTDKTQNKSDEPESKKDSTQSQPNTYTNYHDRIKPVKSIDQIRQEQNQEMKNFIQNAERASLYNDLPNRNSDFFGNQIGQMRREKSTLPIPKKEDTSSVWESVYECLEKNHQENKQRWEIEARIAAQRYIQHKQMEVALLDHHGYIYQRPEQDFTELVKNQIMLESARDKYSAMGSLSYDYWISYKPGQLKKIIRDCDAKTYSLTRQLQDQRIEWKKQSLQEIADKEQARKLQEQADKMKAMQAEIDRKKADIQLIVTCGYVFQASKEVDQKLQETQQQLDDVITTSQKPLSLYNYWLNNNRAELANKIKDLTKAKGSVEIEIDKERQAWQKKSLSQAHALQAYIKIEAQALREAEEARDATDQYFKQVITEKYTSFKERILEFITPNQDAKVDLENLTEYVDSNNLKSSKESIKDSDHRYTMPRTIAQAIRKQLIDESNFYSQKIKWHEINKIDCMLDSMVDAKNNMTVEFAQTGLQAFDDMQKSQSDKEYGYYKNKFTQCYDSLNKKLPTQSIGQSVESVKASDLDTMLQYYTATFENSLQDHGLYQDRFAKRSQALIESQEQVRTNQLVLKEHPMSSQARGFLMANNLNYAAFDTIKATSIQHCLTEENLDIIESSADLAMRHSDNIQIKEFSKQTCNLAIAAQQLNQQSKIQEAAALTNITSVFELYGQSILDDELEAAGWHALGKGAYKGTARALKKWDDFLKRLGHKPKETLGKIGADLQAIGKCLGYAAAEAYQHVPLAYQIDDFNDWIEDIGDLYTNGTFTPRERRSTIRAKRNKDAIKNGTTAVLNASCNIVNNMINKSLEDNIADITEFGVDSLITARVTEGLMQLTQFTGNVLIEAGKDIIESIPKKLIDSPVAYMQTSTGELIAVAEKTGEDLSIVMKNQIALNQAATVKQAKEFRKKVQSFSKLNQTKITQFEKTLEPFLSSKTVVNPDRLKATQGIKQIENFRAKTNNFDQKILDALHPDEKLYLNLCDWLAPQAQKINADLKAAGGLIIRDPHNANIFVKIEEFDLFHSLLGEMQYGSIRKNLSGGHMMIPELKSALCEFNEIQTYWDGFVDIQMKLKRGNSEAFKPKSFFPYGSNPVDCTNMIENTIKAAVNDSKKIQKFLVETDINNIAKFTIEVENSLGQVFKFYIENGQAKYFPFSPLNYK